MGWDFTRDATKDDIVQELLQQFQPKDHELCGDTLWLVWHEEVMDVVLISCVLLASTSWSTGSGWGYKDIPEFMGPAEYSCPLRLLGLAPVANERWRKRVREYHKQRSSGA